MPRARTPVDLRALKDPYSPELTEARWRGTRRGLLRVLFYALLILGGLQLCAVSRKRTAMPNEQPDAATPGSLTSERRDPLT